MFFTIIMLLVTVVVLSIVLWQFHKTIQRLQAITQLSHTTVVTVSNLEQLQKALPGSLWVISVPHSHDGHLVYTALLKEPTTTDQQMQEWASKNAVLLNPHDPNHRHAWHRVMNIVFQKVKDGTPLNWGDTVLIKIEYEHRLPYPDIEQAYRNFISGTVRDPSSSGTIDGLRALRDSAKQATLRQTHFDLPAFKELANP